MLGVTGVLRLKSVPSALEAVHMMWSSYMLAQAPPQTVRWSGRVDHPRLVQ